MLEMQEKRKMVLHSNSRHQSLNVMQHDHAMPCKTVQPLARTFSVFLQDLGHFGLNVSQQLLEAGLGR